MSTAASLSIILLAGVAAFGLSLLARRFLHGLAAAETEPWARTLGYVASAYGVVVGFSIVFLFGQFSDTRQSVGDEAAALATAVENTLLLGDEPETLQHALICYSRAVPAYEWVALRDGGSDAPQVDAAYGDVFTALSELEIEETEVQSAAVKSIVGSLETIAAAREPRHSAADSQIPALLQLFLVGGGVLVVGLIFVVSLGASPLRQALLVGITAVFTTLMVTIVIELSTPFEEGGGQITPARIEHATELMELSTPAVADTACGTGG